MIKFENTVTPSPEQWKAAILGARNAMNSWDRSDSLFKETIDFDPDDYPCNFKLGPKDWELMVNLRNAGTDHRKFMRMIIVYVDITAPLYWWKEFDTYKVGTVANSCSTMHKIADHEFTRDDFSWDHLTGDDVVPDHDYMSSTCILDQVIESLNFWRHEYLTGEVTGIKKDKRVWWQMIQLLPSSYNQKRTVMLNYEVLANIYKSRKNHKLDEWKEHKVEMVGDCPANMYPSSLINYTGFCDWIKTLPYSELITGEEQ